MSAKYHQYFFVAMDAPCELQLYGQSGDGIAALAESIIQEVRRIDATYHSNRPGNCLDVINQVAVHGGTVQVEEETADLLDYAEQCYRLSEGVFDISSAPLERLWSESLTRPQSQQIEQVLQVVGWEKVTWQRPELQFHCTDMALDFSSISKSYAADRVAQLCSAHGLQSGLIELGGDVRVLGERIDGEAWKIGLRDPHHSGAMLAMLEVRKGAVAFRGVVQHHLFVGSERYHHPFNSLTGMPQQSLASVIVAAETCMSAGRDCTTALRQGLNGALWLEQQGLTFHWMDSQGNRVGNLDLLPSTQDDLGLLGVA